MERYYCILEEKSIEFILGEKIIFFQTAIFFNHFYKFLIFGFLGLSWDLPIYFGRQFVIQKLYNVS